MLSVAIIAKDEARHIGACIDSVAAVADEIVVLLDERSSDRTGAICEEKGARVYTEPWCGFGGQRNRALTLCQNPWVFFIDADEQMTAQLRDELAPFAHHNSSEPDHIAGYWIPRYNLFFGHKLRGGGWYPDHQLRLLRRNAAHYDETRLVHEVATLNGDAAFLHGHLMHINIERLDEFWRKQTHFARIEADTLLLSGRRARLRNFVGAPVRELWRRFIRLGGWRDGLLGAFLCSSLAWFEAVAFLRLWGLQRAAASREHR